MMTLLTNWRALVPIGFLGLKVGLFLLVLFMFVPCCQKKGEVGLACSLTCMALVCFQKRNHNLSSFVKSIKTVKGICISAIKIETLQFYSFFFWTAAINIIYIMPHCISNYFYSYSDIQCTTFWVCFFNVNSNSCLSLIGV